MFTQPLVKTGLLYGQEIVQCRLDCYMGRKLFRAGWTVIWTGDCSVQAELLYPQEIVQCRLDCYIGRRLFSVCWTVIWAGDCSVHAGLLYGAGYCSVEAGTVI